MRVKFSALLGAFLVFLLIGLAFARSNYKTNFNTRYGTSATVLNTCNLCHPGGDTASYTPYGTDYLNAGANVAAFAAIENIDSDGDGFSNIVEINARTFPGDPTSFPAGDATAPTVTAFAIPATATALTVPISVFTATDNVAVTGYLVNDVSAKPTAGAAGWAAMPPASYLFATAGAKTLYGWAEDAAGNVSSSASGSVTITLPDATAPTVTAFAIPATSTSLTVTITTFTATDTTGVTGYLITESATAPAASATGWTASAPASYTFATGGAKTLYGWAKDAAGNVSSSASGSVTVTLPDATAPTVTAFAIPATSTSLTVTITTFTVTDTTGVTGYLVTESATAPVASATGWTASAPASYTFATGGAKTLYGWAKDAAGNVSSSASGLVVINLPGAPLGDINGDDAVNLADAILALKVLSGLHPAGIIPDYPTSGADVNGDGRIGMEELSFLLQRLSGLR